MSSCGSKAGMEMSAPLINALVNNTLLHPNLHINQMPPQIIHILHFFSGRLDVPDFVMKCIDIEVKAVQWPEIWMFIWVSYIIALLDWRAEAANDAQNVRADTARR